MSLHAVDPTSTRRRYAAELAAATVNIRARRQLADRGGNLRNLRPQAVAAGHPCVELYDRTTDPDVAVLPTFVALALSVLLRSVTVPGSVPRPQQVEAAKVVAAHFATRSDDASPHGIVRPGGVA